MLHFPSVLMNRLNKTKSAVFLYCRFSLFLKDPFSKLFRILLSINELNISSRNKDTYTNI